MTLLNFGFYVAGPLSASICLLIFELSREDVF